MRKTFPAVLALALAAGLAPMGAGADESPHTVLDYVSAMLASAAQLDLQVSEQQKAGDMAAAQRLVLAASIVRRSAEEFRGAEQDVLIDPVSSLAAPLPQLADAALAKAAEAETRAADHAAFADEAHVTFNALLAALPQKAPHPVLFGMLSGDLAVADPDAAGAPPGHDIVVYGFRLIDPIYNVAPVVLYGRTEIPAANAVLKDDRIDVTLPDAVKAAVRFAPPPCESRASFGLRVRSVYGETFGRWPIVWHTQVLTNSDFYALPTPVIYSAQIAVNAETVSTRTTQIDFKQRGGLTVADCDATKAADVVLPLPENATDVTCVATWVDTTNANRATAHCGVEGRTLHAIGEISGGSKICSPEKLCTCASQAQGWLEASGNYHLAEATSQMRIDADFPPLAFPAGGVAQGRIALGDNQKLRHIALELTRRACPTKVDTVDLSVGDDADAKATGVSKTGAFRASFQSGTLTVGAADAIAASGERTP